MKYTITVTIGAQTVKLVAESTDAAQAETLKNSCLRLLYDNVGANGITDLKVVQAA